MANEVEYQFPVQAVRGKVGKDSKTYMRKCYGKSHQVYLDNPRTRERSSEHEKAYRAHFGQLQTEASAIYRDEVRLAPYRQLFDNQTEDGNMALTGKRKLYVRLDSFVLACLLKERPLVE